MEKRKIASIAAALLAAACNMPAGENGEAYSPRGNPWEPAPKAAATDAKSPASGDASAPKAAGGANATAPAAAHDGSGGTILEQLEAAKQRAAKLDAENAKLKGDVASLTAVVDQLKKENGNLAQAAESGEKSRARVDQEMEALRQQVKEIEARARQLADDVLQERILRVRVERELILAKVQEAENGDGGN
jgi:vacuolar-type H+-ATPase subunit I/STV1